MNYVDEARKMASREAMEMTLEELREYWIARRVEELLGLTLVDEWNGVEL